MSLKNSILFLIIFKSIILFSQSDNPDITSVNPSVLMQGQSYTLNLNTINFIASRMQISFGDGIKINNITQVNDYNCIANVSVLLDASPGIRDILIYIGNRAITATAKITVSQSLPPDILSINPSTLFQGSSYDLALNTIDFDPNLMYLDFGSGINLNNLSCPSRNYCSANVSITNNAQTGLRDVKIIYGNQTIIATAKISIEKEPEPDILSINPNNLNQGKTYDLSLQVQNFDPYKMSLNFGSGTKINSLTCPSKYSCISNLSISKDAELGLRDIKIQYKEKTYTATAKITIQAEQLPDILSINPSNLTKGQSYNLNLNTINFDANIMKVDFGAGITLNSFSCISMYNCSANVSVAKNAQIGIRDVKIIYRDKTIIATAKIVIEEEKLPDVLSSIPSELNQGENYNLNLNTINFDVKTMQLDFGSGITVLSLSCQSPYVCSSNISVSSNAQAGIRDIKIIAKEKIYIATAKITILEEKMPDVLSSIPSELLQGESYVLNLNTINFDPKK